MNHNIALALAIGGGLVGLVLVHALLAGQSAAASAITVGATLTSPFNLSGDTSGSLVNAAGVATPGAASSTPSGGDFAGWTTQVYPAAPPGVPAAGWGAALSTMHDTAQAGSPSGTGFLPGGSH